MTPKEKAKELYNKYFYVNFGMNVLEYDEKHTPIENEVRYRMTKHTAKQCALIAVGEMLIHVDMVDDNAAINYWEQVKQEIELL